MEIKRNTLSWLTRRQVLKYGMYGVASALVHGCWSNGPGTLSSPKGPNVLLISIDTLRKDHCSVYGYARDTTPNLRALADQGARFDLAYAPSASTAPSHATMFTALYPVTHHVLKQGHVLSKEHYTLAECLLDHGYQTAAIVSSFVMNSKFGLLKGFTFFDEDFKSSTASIQQQYWPDQPSVIDQRADETTRKAIDWLKRKRRVESPFFLFVHYFDPHAPYVPPQPVLNELMGQEKFRTELDRIVGHYDGEVAFVDREVGRLLENLRAMGLQENTLIVVTSDHGEGLGQHGHLAHAYNIYEEAVRVPLIFRFPGTIAQGQVFDAPVELIDLAPTILDVIGIQQEGFPFRGQSFAAALCGGSGFAQDRPVYLYRQHYEGRQRRLFSNELIWLKGEKFGVRTGKWKYIEGKEENTKELFDLAADPREQVNLSTTFAQKAAELSTQLNEWKKRHSREESIQHRISEEDATRLEALGYIE